MSLASALDHESRSSPMSHATPIVFVVDDDVSVRESLEALIRCAGWEPETFASAQEFLARPRVLAPSCLVLDVTLPGLNGLDLQKRVAACGVLKAVGGTESVSTALMPQPSTQRTQRTASVRAAPLRARSQ